MPRWTSYSLLLASAASLTLAAVGISPTAPVTARKAVFPAAFEIRPEARGTEFLARGRGEALLLRGGEAVLALAEGGGKGTRTLTMRVAGQQPHRAVAEELRPGRVSYFRSSDRRNWRTRLRTCSRVRYPQVRDGVDLLFYARAQGLEYDLVLAPGAAPGALELGFEGADRTRVDEQGGLELTLGDRTVRHQRPVAYQEVDGHRRPVSAGYRLVSAEVGSARVGFELGAYDPSRPLIIDPEVTFSSYLGGTGYDEGTGIGVDAQGNTYVAGITTSIDFPDAGLPPPGTGNADVFISKLSPDGATLLYSAYLGGDDVDTARGLTVHPDGSLTVVGSTLSTNFPAVAAAQSTPGGGLDGFAARVNAAGTALVYSTYLGGSGEDSVTCAATDGTGADCLAGRTASTNFPTLNALQPALAATTSGDAFVAKLSPTGARVFSTYFGGTGADFATGIAANAAGRIWVAGYTESNDLPTLAAFQPARAGDEGDAFVTSFAPNGGSLLYSTYLGGHSGDSATAIAVDAAGNAYVGGNTESNDFPEPPHAHIHSVVRGGDVHASHGGFSGGEGDAFLVKLDPLGRTLLYSFLVGGTEFDTANAVGVDALGRAYLAGFGASADMVLRYPLQPAYGGGERDLLLAGINARGTTPLFVTQLGATDEERARAMAVLPNGELRITGETSSTDYPTANAFQPHLAGATAFGGDAFVTILNPNTPPPAPTNLKTTIESRRYLRLSWEDQSDDELGFVVERTLAGGSPQILATPAADASSFTDTEVQAGMEYAYRVFARSNAGQSFASNTASGLISAGAKLTVTPQMPKFKTLKVGETQRRPIKLRNAGREAVRVTLEAPEAPFTLVGELPATLAPRQTVTLALDFKPTTAGAFHSHLYLHTSDPRHPEIQIHLMAKGK